VVPSEHSAGSTRSQASITTTDNRLSFDFVRVLVSGTYLDDREDFLTASTVAWLPSATG